MSEPNGNQVAKNTAYLTAASVVQKIMSFFYYFLIAKSLGPTNLGKYSFALMFSSIFVIFMDFGLGPVLTREVARSREKLKDMLEHVLGIKILLVLGSLLLMYGTFFLLRSFREIPDDTVNLVYLASLIVVLDTFTFTFFSIFRAYQNMKYEAIGLVIYQIIIMSLGSTALAFGAPIGYVIGAIIVGSLFHFIYSSTLVFHKLKLSPNLRFSPSTAKTLLKISAPFALAGIFFRLNGSIDTTMLEFLSGERYVGWYNLAFKLTTALTVLPGAFATSFYPAMSYYYKNNKEKLAQTFEHSMFYLFVLSLPITAGVIVLAEPFILGVYSEAFAASISSLQIFMVSLFFVFINYPIGNLLNAADRQTVNTINMGIAMLVNVILNVILIPRYTYIGASIAASVSSIVLVGLGIPTIIKIIDINFRFLFQKFLRVLLASLLMALVLYFLKPVFSLVFLFLLAFVLFFALLFIFRGLTTDEIQRIRAAVFHKPSSGS